MKLLRLFVFLLLFLVCDLHAQSGLARLGEFKINTTTNGNQTNPRMAMDAQGNFVVVWESADSSGLGIWAQRYNPACSPVGSEFQVNTQTANDQRFPSVSMAPDGRFVVVWETADGGGTANGIRGRLYDANGSPVLEFTGSGAESGELHNPSVAMDHDGRFIVAWRKGSGSGNEWVWAQQFNAAGTLVRSAFQTYPGFPAAYLEPSVATNASGDFVIVWYADVADIPGSQIPTQGVFARGYNLDGTTKFGPIRVSPVEETINNKPSVAMRDDGSFVVAWNQTPNVSALYDVYCRRFSASGTALDGNKVLVNTATGGNQDRASISLGPNGEFTVSYYSDGFDGNGLAVVAQRFNSTGTKVGDEFFANTFTAGNQQPTWANGAHGCDTNGNLIFVWQSAAQDGSGWGIYADKFYLPNQGPPLSEFRVNTTTAGDQLMPSVAGNGSGSFVTVWSGPDALGSTDTDIFAQRFNALGGRIGPEIRVNSSTSGKQERPSVAMAADDSFVVVWDDNPAVNVFDVRARAFDADGAPRAGDFIVHNYTTSTQTMCSVAMAPDGQFVVAWTSFRDPGSNYGVYGRLFDALANPLNGEFALHSVTAGTQTFPAVAMHANGSFVATWHSYDPDGSGYGVYARRFDSEGTPLGTDILVPTTTVGDQVNPTVAVRADGGFLIAWNSADTNGTGVFGQGFDANGAPVGSEFRLNSYTTDEQIGPSIAFTGTNAFRAVWSSLAQDGSSYGVFMREFNDLNQPAALDQRVNQFTVGDQGAIDGDLPGFGMVNPGRRKLAVDAVGNFVVTWRSQNQDGSGYGIYATKVFLYPEATVTTQAASPVTDTTATLNGIVNAHGDVAQVSIEYSDNPTFSGSVTGGVHGLGVATGTSDTPVSTMLSGLVPGQTLYFRVRAISSGREVVGQTLSFTTAILPPVVAVPVQKAQTNTTASLDVTVNPKGAATTVLLEYSLSPGGPFTQTAAQNCGNGLDDVVKTFNLTGLTSSSTYTVRAKATNSAGTTQGGDATFTTTGKPGVVTGGIPVAITKTGATLQGTVNPFGIAATAHFEYGLTASYGQSTPEQSAGSGNAAALFEAAISGLEPNQTYHYRLVGTNGAGSTNGADATFKTDPDPPVAVTANPANVTSSSATLRGTVIPLSRATDAYFEWGATTLFGNTTPTQVLPAGSSAVNLEATLTGLSLGGTYYYRMVAMNPGGTTTGADQMFVAVNGGGSGTATAAPTVVTGGTSGRTSTTATLQGTVNPNSGTTTAYFEYGETASYGQTTTPQNLGNGASVVNGTAPVGGLTPAKTYHYRLVAINELGTTNGGDATFTTEPPPAPTVQGGSASGFTQTGATLAGKVNPNGGETSARFEYGLTTAYGSLSAAQNIGSGTALADVSAGLTGLTAGMQYHFRLIATNAGGTTQGTDSTFTTSPPPPTVTVTSPAGSDLGATFATFRGTINSHGVPTSAVQFEYGLTTAYGTPLAVSGTVNSASPQSVSIVIPPTTLAPGTVYHFRLVATTSQGTTQSADATFTTLDPQAPIATDDVIFTTKLRDANGTIDVLLNDKDPDTDSRTGLVLDGTITNQQRATAGTIVANSNGMVTYRPLNGFDPAGDSFVYTVKKQSAPSLTAQGTVRVLSFVPFEGSYVDVFKSTPTDTTPAGGSLTCKLNKLGAGTVALDWLGKRYNDKVVFDATGRAQADLPKIGFPRGTVLHADLRLDPGGAMNVVLTDHQTPSDEGRDFVATLLSAGAGGSDVTAGVHNGFFENGTTSAAAESLSERGVTAVGGFGFNIANISKQKRARFIGRVPDFANYTKGSIAPVRNRYVLNTGLYRFRRVLRGALLGQVDLGGAGSGVSFASDFQWRQDTVTGTAFTGFDRRLILGGELYRASNEGAADVALRIFGGDGRAQVRFEGGGLATPKVAQIRVTLASVLRGNGFLEATGNMPKLKFRMQSGIGRYSGSFVHPDTGVKAKFEGVLRRRSDSLDVRKGAGAFKCDDGATGSVILLPLGT